MSTNDSTSRPVEAAEPSLPSAAQGQPQTYSPKPSRKQQQQRLTTEPHGYIADKITTFLRAIWQLGRGSRKARAPDAQTAAETKQPVGNAPEKTADWGASLTAPPPASPHQHQQQGQQAPAGHSGAQEPGGGVSGLVQQLHHHEPADQLGQPVSTSAKLRNAVMSTVEHALDEAAALQASLGAATAEELSKFRQEAHRGPVITTAGGLPLEG